MGCVDMKMWDIDFEMVCCVDNILNEIEFNIKVDTMKCLKTLTKTDEMRYLLSLIINNVQANVYPIYISHG